MSKSAAMEKLLAMQQHQVDAFQILMNDFVPCHKFSDAQLMLTTEEVATLVYCEGELKDYVLITTILREMGFVQKSQVVSTNKLELKWLFQHNRTSDQE